MKKLALILTAVAMIATLCAGFTVSAVDQTPNPETTDKVVFIDGSQDIFITTPYWGVAAEFVTAGDKTLIKLVGSGEFGIVAASPDTVDASEKAYFEFYVDGSEAADFGIMLRIFDTAGATGDIYGAAGAVDYYLQQNGKWEKYTIGDSCTINCPAGYKGYVRMNIDQFKDCTTGYVGNGNSLNPALINGIWLWFPNQEALQGKTVYLNDLAFVNADLTATETQPGGNEGGEAGEAGEPGDNPGTNPGTADMISVCVLTAVAAAGACVLASKKRR